LSAFEEVKKYLSLLDIPFEINARLVRGLDYYTRTAFEITYEKMDSPQQNALAAGGRYDNLIQELGGSPTPAVGFAMGMERILLAMEIAKADIPEREKTGIYFASLGDIAFQEAFRIIDRLRRKGFYVYSTLSGRSLKSQMREADRMSVQYTFILGGDELSRGVVMLRDMKNSAQREIPLKDIEAEIAKLKLAS
jgi:histidyl-tRNA synthetase